MTPIPKAEEREELVVKGTRVRAWHSELPNWPCMPVLDCSLDSFFSPAGEVGKHPPHRHSGEAKYSFIMEGGRAMDHQTG